MFCIACGRQMSDEERFCSQCGTRRAVIPTDAVASVPTSPARTEQPPSVTPAMPVRPVRSTTEIMPIRVTRPAPPPPDAVPAGTEEEAAGYAVVPWPAEESANPPQLSAPEPPAVREPELIRFTQPRSAREETPARTAEARPSASYASVPFAAPPGSADASPRRSKISPVLIGAVIVALLAVGGIVWMLRSSVSTSSKPGNVEITMFPMTAKVVAGKGADFAATVTGAPSSEVTWKVEEGASAGEIRTRGAYAKEGAISLYATYTAPKAPGTYHLVATSTADPSKSASAEITVVEK
jgi:zinc-ribbon domain/Immunoglobulin I-set domain